MARQRIKRPEHLKSEKYTDASVQLSENSEKNYRQLLKNLSSMWDKKSMERNTPFYFPKDEFIEYNGKKYTPYFIELQNDYHLEDVVLTVRCIENEEDGIYPDRGEWFTISPGYLENEKDILKMLLLHSNNDTQRQFSDIDRMAFVDAFANNISKDRAVSFDFQDRFYDVPHIEEQESELRPDRNNGRVHFKTNVNGLPQYGCVDYTVKQIRDKDFQIETFSLKMKSFGNVLTDVSHFLKPEQKKTILDNLILKAKPRVCYGCSVLPVVAVNDTIVKHKRERKLLSKLPKR